MTAWLLSLIDVKWLLGGLGALVFGLIAMFKGRADGAAKEKAKQANDRLKAVNKAKEVEHEVDSLGHADVDQRLRRWLRDGK